MSTTPSKRTRSERVASLQTDPTQLKQWLKSLSKGSTLLQFCIALLFAVLVSFCMRGWNPPFAYRQGYIPPRAIVARVAFKLPDVTKTEVLKAQQSREVVCFYEHRQQPLVQLRNAIKGKLIGLYDIPTLDQLDSLRRQSLDELLARPPGSEEPTIAPQDALAAIVATIGDQANRDKLDSVLVSIFQPIEELGLLKTLNHDIDRGNQRWIRVFPSGQENKVITVEIEKVRIAEVFTSLKSKLKSEFRREFNRPEAEVVADLVQNFLSSRLPETLTYRSDLSEKARQQAIASVPPAMISFQPVLRPWFAGSSPDRERSQRIASRVRGLVSGEDPFFGSGGAYAGFCWDDCRHLLALRNLHLLPIRQKLAHRSTQVDSADFVASAWGRLERCFGARPVAG